MKTPWIGTSWKMNKTRAEARFYAETRKASSVASTRARAFIIPPFTIGVLLTAEVTRPAAG